MQIDEFMITKRTWPTHVWSQPRDNLMMDQSKVMTEAYAVVMAISRERGIELVDIYKKSINKMKFKMFLERLKQLN